MKGYVVSIGMCNEGGIIEGIFSTREKALNFVKKQVNLNDYDNEINDFYTNGADFMD